LVELMLVIGLIAIATFVFAGVSVSLNADRRGAVTFNGLRYEALPSRTADLSAVAFHSRMASMVHEASITFVFGGANANPLSGANLAPLQYGLGAVSFSEFPSANIRYANNSYSVRSAMPTFFSNYTATSWGTNDFSIVFLKGDASVIGVATVKREVSGTNVFYSANLCRSDGYVLNYRFWLPSNEDVWDEPVGASHSWIQYDTNFREYEEGSCKVVFPDPVRLAGRLSGVPASAYSYTLTVLK